MRGLSKIWVRPPSLSAHHAKTLPLRPLHRVPLKTVRSPLHRRRFAALPAHPPPLRWRRPIPVPRSKTATFPLRPFPRAHYITISMPKPRPPYSACIGLLRVITSLLRATPFSKSEICWSVCRYVLIFYVICILLSLKSPSFVKKCPIKS